MKTKRKKQVANWCGGQMKVCGAFPSLDGITTATISGVKSRDFGKIVFWRCENKGDGREHEEGNCTVTNGCAQELLPSQV